LKLADSAYDNSVPSVVAKLLVRGGDLDPQRDVPGVGASRGKYEHIPEDVRRPALVAAYYLSRFQHERLQLGNQDQTFEAVAAKLGIKKHTLKNYRDRFDPHTDSGRRGWWQAELTTELANVIAEFREQSEEHVRAYVLDALQRPASTREEGR
jgi:hypothetical protein